MKRVLKSLAVAACFSASPATADDNAAANRLFVAAVTLLNEVLALSDDTVSGLEGRVTRLEIVQANLDRIVSDHSGSDLAVQLVIGAQVGPLSRQRVDRELNAARQRLAMAKCSAELSSACVLAEASDLAQRMATDVFVMVSMSRLAVAQARAGLIADAMETATGIETEALRESALSRIREVQSEAALAREGRRDMPPSNTEDRDGTMSFQAALEAARALETGSVNRARTLVQLTLDRPEHDLITEALEAARSIEDLHDRIWVIGRLAVAHPELRLFGEMLVLARGIERDLVRLDALILIAELLSE